MTVLSTFLKSSLNLLANNLKIATRLGTVKEKNGDEVLTVRNTI